LLDEIIVFVNNIVKIVHECAKHWDGIPINNNGDKYILAWKLPTTQHVKSLNRKQSVHSSNDESPVKLNEFDDIKFNQLTDQKDVKPFAPWSKDEPDDFEDIKYDQLDKMREEIADKALISSVKTVAELMRDTHLQNYSRHPKISPKFGNYKTEISFGIHVGNSIEGSIGTKMKVDALYISSDVVIAQRVDGLNELY
jgi:class 3 adenylate cyclase